MAATVAINGFHTSGSGSLSPNGSGSGPKIAMRHMLMVPLGALMVTLIIFIIEVSTGKGLFHRPIPQHLQLQHKQQITKQCTTRSTTMDIIAAASSITGMAEMQSSIDDWVLDDKLGEPQWWSSSRLTIFVKQSGAAKDYQRTDSVAVTADESSVAAVASDDTTSASAIAASIDDNVCVPCGGLLFVTVVWDTSSIANAQRLVTSLQWQVAECPLMVIGVAIGKEQSSAISAWQNVLYVDQSANRLLTNAKRDAKAKSQSPVASFRVWAIATAFATSEQFKNSHQRSRGWPWHLPFGCTSLGSNWYSNRRVIYMDANWLLARRDLSLLQQSMHRTAFTGVARPATTSTLEQASADSVAAAVVRSKLPARHYGSGKALPTFNQTTRLGWVPRQPKGKVVDENGKAIDASPAAPLRQLQATAATKAGRHKATISARECTLAIQGYHHASAAWHTLRNQLANCDTQSGKGCNIEQELTSDLPCTADHLYWPPYFVQQYAFHEYRSAYLGPWVRKSRGFAIVMPYISAQVPRVVEQFDLWDKLRPCSYEVPQRDDNAIRYNSDGIPTILKPDLYLFNSQVLDEFGLNNLTRSFYSHAWSRRCFRSLRFVDGDLNATLDVHPYGPNQQYLAIMNSSLFQPLRETTDYFMMMEPDAFPVRNNWLTSLTYQTDGDPFSYWGKGATYEGGLKERDPLDYRVHINGNGLWSLSDAAAQFARDMYLNARCPGWDHEIFCYVCRAWHRYRTAFHHFKWNRFIINLWHINWDSDEVLRRHPSAYFVHGKQRDGAGLRSQR